MFVIINYMIVIACTLLHCADKFRMYSGTIANTAALPYYILTLIFNVLVYIYIQTGS